MGTEEQTTPLDAGCAPSPVETIVGKTRMQFTAQNLMAAASFSRRVGAIEREQRGQRFGPFFDEILWNASACVMLAVAGIETYLNEIIADRSKHFPGHDATLLAELWKRCERDKLLDKFDLVLTLLDKPLLERGAEPVQSVDALLLLRNELVHFKPEWFGQPKVHAKVSARLRTKVEPSPFLPGEDIFPRAWASHSCTRWAVTTCVDFGQSIAQHLAQKSVFEQFAERLLP